MQSSFPAVVDEPKARAASGESVTRILVVDDEETIRLALSKFLRGRGYVTDMAPSGDAALEALTARHYTLVLCDVRMPGMSGVTLVRQALSLDPELAIMMLTAVNDAPTATDALAAGACDYLMKPIELPELHQAVERALRKRTLAMEQRRVDQMLREEVATRTTELAQEQAALRALSVSIVHTLVNAMEAKDPYLRGRSQRVAELAASIADVMGLDEDTVEAVRLAGRLADVGLIGIREVVLHKPSSLTRDEFEHVQQHLRIGMEILAPLAHLGPVLEFVRDHHEHVDGSGYPRGLHGDSISIGGRVLAAADAFDALTSRRAYREPLSPSDTLDHLATQVGTLLDPRVFAALRTVILRRKSLIFIDDLHA
jgi:putative two-component system response regulator